MQLRGRLRGKVAVVAGATRGAGRGIACVLGEAGATVYCTGRSVRGKLVRKDRPETIDETARLVTERGGKGIAVQVDHTDEKQVRALFRRVEKEQDGRLDILVNDLTGDAYMEWKPFLEHSLEKGLKMLQNGSISHIITSRYAIPLMIGNRRGLIIEMTDGVTDEIRDFNFYYDLEKATNIRMARALASQRSWGTGGWMSMRSRSGADPHARARDAALIAGDSRGGARRGECPRDEPSRRCIRG